MVRRIALLATFLLCRCNGCRGCGDCAGGSASASSHAADAAARAAIDAASAVPAARRATSGSSSAAAPDASMPAWPPQGAACTAFAACCEAARPQPAARTVCMLSYNETRDCARAAASFVRKLKTLGAPIPDACGTPQ